jgi:hypothetical protein
LLDVWYIFEIDCLTPEDVESRKQYFSTQGDTPYNFSSLSDQVASKLYPHVINAGNYYASSTNLPVTSTFEVNKNNLKLSFYDPSNIFTNNIKVKPTYLLFYKDTLPHASINYTFPTNTDPHNRKALPSKKDYEKFWLFWHLDHMIS